MQTGVRLDGNRSKQTIEAAEGARMPPLRPEAVPNPLYFIASSD